MPIRQILFDAACPHCKGTGVCVRTLSPNFPPIRAKCEPCGQTGLSLGAIRANLAAGVEPEATQRRVRALDTRQSKTRT
jgi:hypothetical protein